MPWDFWLILIFLAVALPLLGKRRIRHLLEYPLTTRKDRLRLYISTIVSQWLAAAIILWRATARGMGLLQLGIALPRPTLTFLVSAVLTAIITANQLLSIREFARRPSQEEGILPQLAGRVFPQDSLERVFFIPLVLTVAFCEEIIYRGFVQALFRFATGSALIAIAGSAILFAIAQLYQGRKGIKVIFVVGIIFSVARAWTGSLIPAMISHGVADAAAGLLMPKKLAPQTEGGY
jgi:membrane protease YdiL (CAAX protease family)